MAKGTIQTLPIEPLVRIAELMVANGDEGATLTNDTFANMIGFSQRTVVRWRKAGKVPWTKADKAAINLSLHPLNIWGDEWSDLDAEYVAKEIAREAQETLDAVTS